MTQFRGIAAARERSDDVDRRVAELSTRLGEAVAVVALAAYGRGELTPRTDVEVLFLHSGEVSTPWVTEAVCYPLWEHNIRVEPSVRTLFECAADARRSWSAATSFLDARFVAGNPSVYEDFVRQVAQPWRRDRERLRHRLRIDAQDRRANRASAVASAMPDLEAGRGGLLDLHALRWLCPEQDGHLIDALDFLLRALATLEDLVGQVPRRLSLRLQERLAAALSPGGARTDFLAELYRHARWVAFSLDGALAPNRDDRQLGASLALRRGELVADRLPPIQRAPSMGLRVANLVGLAPPGAELRAWAAAPGPPVRWDDATLDQFWLLLRAADWRAWDFLDVTGLLVRYLPELHVVWRHCSSSGADDLALDSHCFYALRALHEWTESGDPLGTRALRPLRRRDWLYLAVLLHELAPESATDAATRLGLPNDACAALGFAVGNYRRLGQTASERDLQDEDLLLELATQIRTRQRLSLVFLVAIAHDLASGPTTWTAWKADLMRQLFTRLEAALRQSGEVGPRRTRSLEQHRARITHELQRRKMTTLLPLVARLPRRYVLARSPAFVARHLSLLAGAELADGEFRMQAHRHRQPGVWDVLIVARDRPGLLATVAGVLALRGTSVLAADAATCADGLVLDVFTVGGAFGVPVAVERWPAVAADIRAALEGRVPLRDLLGARVMEPEEAAAVHVSVDNAASQFFSVIEVRAPDQVGLLYRITRALHELGLDIHHAKIATHPEGALDVFYVWDLSGEKLDAASAARTADSLAARLKGDVPR
ncbi:MAG TPA: ACT domain-containing protein [Chloroflexota bacterium]|nr:ACT domain-containing protein [Chloroflexota bacterium]